MGSNLTETSTYSANVVGPDAGNLVTAASVRVMGTAITNRTKYLNDNKASLAGATFTGVVTGDVGEFTWPASPSDRKFSAYENNGATVSASNAFVMKKDFTIAAVVPDGPGGHTPSAIWTTPSARWILDGAVMQITGNCTADADPANVELILSVGTVEIIIGIMDVFDAGGGTIYTVDGTTTNPTIFGLKTSEKSVLLTPPLTSSETDDLGYGLDEDTLSVVALADGGANGIWGKNITVNVTHGSITPRTLSLPVSIIMWGRLI